MAHNVSVSRDRYAPAATCKERPRDAAPPRGGWVGAKEFEGRVRAARNMPVSRDRDAPAATPMEQPRGGSASGTQRARLAQSRRASGGTHGATARRCPPSSRSWGRGESGAQAALNVLVSRDRDAPAAAHMVLPRGAALPAVAESGAQAARYVPVSRAWYDEAAAECEIMDEEEPATEPEPSAK